MYSNHPNTHTGGLYFSTVTFINLQICSTEIALGTTETAQHMPHKLSYECNHVQLAYKSALHAIMANLVQVWYSQCMVLLYT